MPLVWRSPTNLNNTPLSTQQCNSCLSFPIIGARHTCQDAACRINLCSACFRATAHGAMRSCSIGHEFRSLLYARRLSNQWRGLMRTMQFATQRAWRLQTMASTVASHARNLKASIEDLATNAGSGGGSSGSAIARTPTKGSLKMADLARTLMQAAKRGDTMSASIVNAARDRIAPPSVGQQVRGGVWWCVVVWN